MESVPRWTWFVLFLIVAGLVILGIVKVWPARDRQAAAQISVPLQYPFCGNSSDVKLDDKIRRIEIELYPDCLSGKIKVIPGKPFVVDTLRPGDLEFFFWNGQRLLFKDKTVKWLDTKVPSATFRLRGNGPATIYVD